MMFRPAEFSVRRSWWGTLPLREFLIDGNPLQHFFRKVERNRVPLLDTCVSPLGWLDAAGSQVSLARFLPDGPADFPNGHRAILVCRECGDFGCGALTARIASVGGEIVWSDWLWQVDYDDSMRDDFDRRIPAFAFARDAYLRVLRDAVT
jgi:hypothetical protein